MENRGGGGKPPSPWPLRLGVLPTGETWGTRALRFPAALLMTAETKQRSKTSIRRRRSKTVLQTRDDEDSDSRGPNKTGGAGRGVLHRGSPFPCKRSKCQLVCSDSRLRSGCQGTAARRVGCQEAERAFLNVGYGGGFLSVPTCQKSHLPQPNTSKGYSLSYVSFLSKILIKNRKSNFDQARFSSLELQICQTSSLCGTL